MKTYLALASPVAVGGEAPAAWPRSDIAAGGLS
jgi:hypothetical protein